jgi:hypothetical protein
MGFSLTKGPVVKYAQEKDNSGFFKDVTTVLSLSGSGRDDAELSRGPGNHPSTLHRYLDT